MTITPDTKDWTWVLGRPCPECGFAADAVTVDQLGPVIRDNATSWEAVLTLDDVAVRPEPTTWSPLEYACHVRDVHRIFDLRVGMMLEEVDPQFPNWDQDESAITERYAEQDPAVVSVELMDAAVAVADRYESVPPDAWSRRGYRSNGSEFTVESIGLYHLHDIVHHVHDVRAAVARATVDAYNASATAYRDGSPPMTASVHADLRVFATAVGEGGRVLEIGSGPGRDARLLEELGLDVRRTDISTGFVELLRAEGHEADRLDPLTDDLDDPARPGTPYDGVWAAACLLHVPRVDLPTVLARLAEATRPGGVLGLALKEGDGEGWSRHGHVSAPRHFVYWRAEPLRAALEGAGWQVDHLNVRLGTESGQPWLEVRASRR
ncbi:class I SAM-dependent methyltransferase [Nocardioides sp. CN2-186]|uniref:class I SAM-dependent methyltransferase n=1 Tax=Nocardioides tweenelious TaxID=3156607 RepID=UPI0032B461FA